MIELWQDIEDHKFLSYRLCLNYILYGNTKMVYHKKQHIIPSHWRKLEYKLYFADNQYPNYCYKQ